MFSCRKRGDVQQLRFTGKPACNCFGDTSGCAGGRKIKDLRFHQKHQLLTVFCLLYHGFAGGASAVFPFSAMPANNLCHSLGWRQSFENTKQKTRTNKTFVRVLLEVLDGFEPSHEGFADPCLTTWLQHHIGAAYEARTRYLHLGKVALYQMS